ncbi:hypothetical protein MMC20_006387 [Loxospora ochrophaea]|nr:hypothetical protein [Loxospora ochrophaea]
MVKYNFNNCSSVTIKYPRTAAAQAEQSAPEQPQPGVWAGPLVSPYHFHTVNSKINIIETVTADIIIEQEIAD